MTSAADQNRFRILALDGGGIRGVFAAAFLARLEAALGTSLGKYFDLIVGTSTGGIVALGLAAEIPAAEIQSLYERDGPAIFKRRQSLTWKEWIAEKFCRWRGIPIDGDMIFDARYDGVALSDALRRVFGDKTVRNGLKNRVVIPSVDITTGRTVVFRTPHQPDFIRDGGFPLVDVARATAAAPIYFPPSKIQGSGGWFVDGGLWANNPSIVGLAEASQIRQRCKRPENPSYRFPEDVYLLSIGTGNPNYKLNDRLSSFGIAGWGANVLDVMYGAHSQGVHHHSRLLLSDDQYSRVNFDLPAPWALDDISRVPDLIHYGDQAAVEQFPRLREVFFDNPCAQVSFY